MIIKYSVLSFEKIYNGCKLVAKNEIKECCLKAADENPATDFACDECSNTLSRIED